MIEKFIDDFGNELHDWSLRYTLEVFSYYIKGGIVGANKFIQSHQRNLQ